MVKFKLNDIIYSKESKHKLLIIRSIVTDQLSKFYGGNIINKPTNYPFRYHVRYVDNYYDKVSEQQAEWIKLLYL